MMLEKARKIHEELIRLRRDIHQHPELSFQEVRTAALVADTLHEIGGIEVWTGIGRTGVVGQLGSRDGPTIAIRADMDALPIQEKTGVPYASQNDGVMHACGHDAHTAILLGVARLLRQSQAEEPWQGNVRFLFQPSEETFDADGNSGATAMIDDGALENVAAVIALHVRSTAQSGQLYFSDEYSLAADDSFEATIYGPGGHGAYPHNATDPLFILSTILPSLYAIPSRQIDPLAPNVVSLGQINGGTSHSVIPQAVHLKGTVRSMNEVARERLWKEVERAFRIAEMHGGRYDFRVNKGSPPLFNAPWVNRCMREVVRDLLGDCYMVNQRFGFGMGAEDFSFMAQKAPGAMFMLGAALDDEVQRAHHTDIFNIDESVLPVGAAILAETARRFVTGEFTLLH